MMRYATPVGWDDKQATGAVLQLADVVGSELLADIKQHVQRVWIRVFTLELIRRELPLAYAKWATDESRASGGALPLFLYSWWQNAAKGERKPAAPRKPKFRQTSKPCKEGWYERTRFCTAHASNEICELEGRRSE